MFVQVLDKEIAASLSIERASKMRIANFEIVGVDLRDIASIKVHGMAQLVVVHAMVGIERHAIGASPRAGSACDTP